MTQKPNPAFPSLNQVLTIWGVERRQFFLAAIIAAGVFNTFGSALGGVLMFAALYGGARWAAGQDPDFFPVFFRASSMRRVYDPAKHVGRRRLK